MISIPGSLSFANLVIMSSAQQQQQQQQSLLLHLFLLLTLHIYRNERYKSGKEKLNFYNLKASRG